MKKIFPVIAPLVIAIFLFAVSTPAQSDKKLPKNVDPRNHGIIITKRLRPRLSKAADDNRGINGQVILRVTFLNTGEIGDVVFVSDEPAGVMVHFDMVGVCIAAAKKIKFIPAIKDGEPYTVTKSIEYAFRT